MNGRTAGRLAWGIACACFAMAATALVLLYLNRAAIDSFNSSNVFGLVAAVTFGALGGVVASRRRRHQPDDRLRCLGGVHQCRLHRARRRHRFGGRNRAQAVLDVGGRRSDRDRLQPRARTSEAPGRPPRLRRTSDAVRGALGVLREHGRDLRARRHPAEDGSGPCGRFGGRAAIWLRVGDVLRSASIWPTGSEPVDRPAELSVSDQNPPAFPDVSKAAPVLHHGELLGAITVTKPPNDPLRPAEAKLIEDLAGQAGLVLRNARLNAELMARLEDLRASRQRLVTAQDEERRKLERNIHDGAQQQLVALSVKLRLLGQLAERDTEKTKALAAQLQVESTEALENLRDLARGIYPPLLADKGLAAALESQARKSVVPVTVEFDGIGRHPQEIEAAVYFCCLEALQNIAKYADATTATIRLSDASESLTFVVSDDGRGFDPASTGYGTGLQGMADRLDALGGSLEVQSAPSRGTTVTGRVPARSAEG
jgi:signal transduction histidine kinase